MKDRFSFLLTTVKKHPFLTLFALAFVLRISLAAVVAYHFKGIVFEDERLYFYLIDTFTSGNTSEWNAYHHQLWGLSLGFLVPGSIAYKVSGGSVFAVLCVSAIVGSLVPTFTAKILHRHTSLQVAMIIGVAMSLVPSQILWSSLLAKDSFIVLGFIATANILPRWVGASTLNSFVAKATFLFLVLMYIQRIRVHSLVVACIAIVISAVLSRSAGRLVRVAVSIAFLCLVPWLAGGGVGGVHFMQGLSEGVQDQRAASAVGATALEAAKVSVPESGTTNLQSSLASSDAPRQGFAEDLKYLPLGLKVMLIDPTVSQLGDSGNLYFAFGEHLIWYPALITALWGAVRRRHWPVDLVFCAVLFFGLTSMWALVEGNFGTAFRHRTEFVWIVFLFAGLGVQQIMDDVQQGRRPNY